MATTKRESPLGSGKDIKPTKLLTTTPSFIPTLSKRPPPKQPTPTTTKLPLSHKNVRNRLTKPSQVPSSRLARKVQRISPVVVKKPALSARSSMHGHSKASLKSNAPVRTVQRGVTPPKKVNAKALTPPLKKTSIVTQDLTPFEEVKLEDRYVMPDEVEEIANIGSDDDLVPFDQMEFPEMKAHDSAIVVDHDPAILVPSEVTVNEETENHLVEEEVRVSNQRSEDHSVGTSDQETEKEESIASTGDEVVEEEKEEASVRPKAEKRKQSKGKKETPVVYNDVIEETASKLLEKRKNKVRALVGAFETVISLQD